MSNYTGNFILLGRDEDGNVRPIRVGSDGKIPTSATLPSIENTIDVAKSGGDFTTIKAAMTASSPGDVIVVHPGVYIEDNPLPSVSQVTVLGIGGRATTTIQAANANQNLFTTGDNLTIESVTFSDVSGVLSWVIDINQDHGVIIKNCTMLDCSNGIKMNSSNANVNVSQLFIETDSSSTDIAIQSNSGNLNICGGEVYKQSTVNVVFNLDGASAISTIRDFVSFSANVGSAIEADNSSRSVIYSSSFVAMDYGVIAGGGVNLQLVSTSMFNATQDNIRITNSGSNTQVSAQSVVVEGAGSYDVNVLSSSATIYGFAIMSPDKLNFVSGANLIGATVSLKEGDESLDVYRELHVGIPELGAEAAFGKGDSYTRGMIVYTFNPTGSVFTDVSVEARSASGSTFTFPATAINNAIYVASSLSSDGSVLKHSGIKAIISTAVTVGSGEIITEYWNGSSWSEIDTMSTYSSDQYMPYGNSIFQRTGSEQIRYDINTVNDGWTANDPVSLGQNYFWVRYRISSAITTSPVFQQWKLHTDRTEINSDGFMEFFGNARTQNSIFDFTLGNFQAALSSPSNQDLYIGNAGGDRLGYGLIENEFVNTIDRIARANRLPPTIDTSSGLDIEWSFIVSTTPVAGQFVRWQIQWGLTKNGDTVDQTSNNTGNTTIQTKTIDVDLTGLSIEEQKSSTLHIEIPSAVSRASSEFGDILWMQFSRIGSSDTYTGNCSLININAKFWNWCVGGHI